jgi:hypothetical protein
MTETIPTRTTSDAAAQELADSREATFALALASKLEQGYHVESQGKTDAVLYTNGPKRWFGLVAGTQGRRRRIALEDDGRVSTRGL